MGKSASAVHDGADSTAKQRVRYSPRRLKRVQAVEHAVGYAMHSSRSRDAVIRVYDDAGNVIETHEHEGDFEEAWRESPRRGFKDRKIKNAT